MNEFQQFVTHVRNLKEKNVTEATFNVSYLHSMLATVAPSQDSVKAQRINSWPIFNDGGKFSEE